MLSNLACAGLAIEADYFLATAGSLRRARRHDIATLGLGAFVKSIRGKSGNSVFAQTKRGTIVRDRVLPTAPASPAQQAVRNNMRKDGAAWQGLSVVQQQAWSAAAAKTTKKGKKSGKAYVPSGYQLFTALSTKWLQINGTGTIPAAPPTGSFAGDVISLTALGGTGSVTFTASAASAAGTKVELLVQGLKGKSRKPVAKGYVSKGFVAFAAGSLSSTVSLPSGYWAVGYRFVEVATGRETAIAPISVLTVALSVEDGGAVETKAKRAA